ncbi:23S rRNA (pseudouridine(1915)-N(3))-methyltransferase RlmH [Legionella sp. D16C41]|uniref:23S rRNA (pseudouridine(1915)-N(3))-methyltransferase RlmH n=1 Tax=Legionella sp. D16C41 TaxID=3402688 RepID=UPI003AF80C42
MFKITIISCGNKMPTWVEQGTNEYSKRLKEYVKLNLIEIPLIKRTKSSDLKRIQEKEALLINSSIPESARVIALAINGETFSSEKLATKFATLQRINSHICLIIGGPEGLTEPTLARCQEQWSLSALTLPHPLVRIILLEAIYRAWSILNNHPYHK